jgi:hypothetical protein
VELQIGESGGADGGDQLGGRGIDEHAHSRRPAGQRAIDLARQIEIDPASAAGEYETQVVGARRCRLLCLLGAPDAADLDACHRIIVDEGGIRVAVCRPGRPRGRG